MYFQQNLNAYSFSWKLAMCCGIAVISVPFTLSCQGFIPNVHDQLKGCSSMDSFWTRALPCPLFVSYISGKYLLALWNLKTTAFQIALHNHVKWIVHLQFLLAFVSPTTALRSDCKCVSFLVAWFSFYCTN